VRRLDGENRCAPARLLWPDIVRADLDLGARPGTTDPGASALSHVIHKASSACSARSRRSGVRA
jgi:hypothetical protein